MASNIIKAGTVNIFRFRDRFWWEFRGGSLDIHNIIIALFWKTKITVREEDLHKTMEYLMWDFNEAKIN